MSGWRVGVDVGGTFTDVALVEESTGRQAIRKVPTDMENPVQGVLSCVREALEAAHLGPEDVSYFGAGTTLALNTVIQRSGVKTGLLVTQGYRDVLEIRRIRLPDAPSYDAKRPIPLVRRALVREVPERMLADGTVLRPLDDGAAEAAAAELLELGAEAIALCFLHSYTNPAHERAARDEIAARWPDLFLCISSETWPQQREYERTLVTVMNAFTGPTMQRYYRRLEEGLRQMGIHCPILVTQSNGGTMPAADAASTPVRTMLSGPASGVMASVKEAQAAGMTHFFTLDMGGTSADMAVVDGSPRFSTESAIGDYPLFMPAVAISTLGAGGGSVAWVDAQGFLKVGPRSAGAMPGPVCYGLGGTEPAVTDAYLHAGIIGADDLLGGDMKLSPELAAQALEDLGKKIGLDSHETAEAILRIATANMYAEFLPMIARYGIDQREFVLVPYGGAGPTHAFFLAEEVGLTRLLIPRPPGAMCALGAALTDLQMDFVRSIRSMLSDAGGLDEVFKELEEEAVDWLSAQDIPAASAEFERSCDMRFHGQSFDLTVSLSDGESPDASFRRSYEQVYGYQDPECPIEVLQLRLLARVPNPRPNVEADGASPRGGTPVPAGEREIYYRGGTIRVPVYRRSELPREVRLPGPAVVTQYDTTIFITPPFEFWTDFRGNIRAEVKP